MYILLYPFKVYHDRGHEWISEAKNKKGVENHEYGWMLEKKRKKGGNLY